MMEKAEHFDSWLFTATFGFQNIANCVERLCAVRYYTQVRGLIVLYAAFYVQYKAIPIFASKDLVWQNALLYSSFSLILALLLVGLWLFTVTARAHTDRGHRNPWRDLPTMIIMRLGFVFFLILSVGIVVLSGVWDGNLVAYNLFMFLAFYLMACDEAPPQRDTAPAH